MILVSVVLMIIVVVVIATIVVEVEKVIAFLVLLLDPVVFTSDFSSYYWFHSFVAFSQFGTLSFILQLGQFE